MLVQGQVTSAVPSSRPTGNPNIYQAMLGEVAVSEILGRYSNLVQSGQVFSAFAAITAPVIFSTAAGTGGPLLWNSSSTKAAHILAFGIGTETTVTTAGGTLGLTGNSGQTSAPTTTTAITASGNMLIGGPASAMNVYNIGTVANAGNRFLGFGGYGAGAITNSGSVNGAFYDVGGIMVIPPNCWGSVAASATMTSAVIGLSLVWAELPV